MILRMENIIKGGISSVMGDRYVVSDDNKKVLYKDDNIMYGHWRSQALLSDEIEFWHGHPGFNMNKLEEFLNTPDESYIGFFVEFDVKYSDNIKEKRRTFYFVLKLKRYLKNILMNIWKKLSQKRIYHIKK